MRPLVCNCLPVSFTFRSGDLPSLLMAFFITFVVNTSTLIRLIWFHSVKGALAAGEQTTFVMNGWGGGGIKQDFRFFSRMVGHFLK